MYKKNYQLNPKRKKEKEKIRSEENAEPKREH